MRGGAPGTTGSVYTYRVMRYPQHRGMRASCARTAGPRSPGRAQLRGDATASQTTGARLTGPRTIGGDNGSTAATTRNAARSAFHPMVALLEEGPQCRIKHILGRVGEAG